MELYYATFVPSLLLDCLYQSAHYEKLDGRLIFREEECTHRWNEFAEYVEVNPDYDAQALPYAKKEDWECGLRMVLEVDLINPRNKGGCHFYDLLCCDFLWTEGTLPELFESFMQKMIPTDGEGNRLLFHNESEYAYNVKYKLDYYERMAIVGDLALTTKKVINFWSNKLACGQLFYFGNPQISTCRNVIMNDFSLRTYNFEFNTVFMFQYSYDELTNKKGENKKRKTFLK